MTRSDFPVHWPVLTRWTDNDMFGHLNNAVYYELFDTAINAWINTSCDIDPLTVPWLGVVAESGCKYFAELKFPEPLTVDVLQLGSAHRTENGVIAFVAVLLLDGQLFGYGIWVASGVIEEKASRVVEMLLSAIRARQLLLGKIVGIGVLP